MRNATLLVLGIATILLFSCSKGQKANSYTTADYLIVGRVGGFVMLYGPFYKITASQLQKNTTHYSGTYPIPVDASAFNFNYPLPAARYDTVKSLLSSIPTELFNKNNADIGDFCPDFGFTDVRASINGTLYKWSFECDQSKSSTAIQAFVNQIRADF